MNEDECIQVGKSSLLDQGNDNLASTELKVSIHSGAIEAGCYPVEFGSY